MVVGDHENLNPNLFPLMEFFVSEKEIPLVGVERDPSELADCACFFGLRNSRAVPGIPKLTGPWPALLLFSRLFTGPYVKAFQPKLDFKI